jgi:hypothetical protein
VPSFFRSLSQRFRNAPPPPRELFNLAAQNVLYSALATDVDTFVALLGVSDADSAARALRGRRGQHFFLDLSQLAIELDQPAALGALRAFAVRLDAAAPSRRCREAMLPPPLAVAQQALQAGGSRLVLQAVADRILSPLSLSRPLADLSRSTLAAQCETGLLVPSVYMTLFPDDHLSALKWVRQGLWPYREFVEMRHIQPETVVVHRVGELIGSDAALTAYPPASPAAAQLAQQLVEAQCVPAARVVQTFRAQPWLQGPATQWAEARQLCCRDLLRHVPGIPTEHLERLHAQGHLSLQDWQHYARPPAQLLFEACLRNELSADACVQGGQLTAEQLSALQRAGRLQLSPRALLTAQSSAFVPDQRLTAEQLASVLNFSRLSSLLAGLNYPQSPKWRLNYAARMAAAFCHPSLVSSTRPATQVTTAGASSVAPAPPSGSFTCAVCTERVCGSPDKLAACPHAATFCAPCMARSLLTAANDRCPYPGCDMPVSPEDLLERGLDGSRAVALAQRLVARYCEGVPDWLACPTSGCVGGTSRTRGERRNLRNYRCITCQKRVNLEDTFVVDLQLDRSKIARLVRDLASKGPYAACTGLIRECYHCGSPNEHTGGCPNMQCGRCKQPYHFNSGTTGCSSAGHGQTYVPLNGLLLHAGLYRGLTPGATYSNSRLRTVVDENVLRLHLWTPEACAQ